MPCGFICTASARQRAPAAKLRRQATWLSIRQRRIVTVREHQPTADPPARSGAFEASRERSTRSSAAIARAPGSGDLSGRRAGSRPARATILSCRLSSMAERCVVAAETLDRYRQAVPNIRRVAHRQSGGLQNRVREGSIPSSPANLCAPGAGLSPKTLKVTAKQYG
jgi:hypothetical protein